MAIHNSGERKVRGFIVYPSAKGCRTLGVFAWCFGIDFRGATAMRQQAFIMVVRKASLIKVNVLLLITILALITITNS
jgi:hypothetical protein